MPELVLPRNLSAMRRTQPRLGVESGRARWRLRAEACRLTLTMPDMRQEIETTDVPSYPEGIQKSMSPAWRDNFVATLQLAWPMVLTNLAQTAMIVTDRFVKLSRVV